MKKLRFVTLAAAVLIAMTFSAAVFGGCASEARRFEREVFDLTNEIRAEHGLQPLIWNDSLARAARDHARDMRDNDMRGHVGSDGSTVRERVERAGITNAGGWSENMAYGQRTPRAVVDAWMNSEGHRANILRAESTHLGVGFVEGVEGSQWVTYWAQKFVIMD